jgi:ribosomal protein S18 acetylase RimI-like enzyme
VEIRRLGPGDEDVVRKLATRPPHFELLEDERTILLAAFEDGEPIGFALAHHLPRRHDPPAKLLVYEVDVDEAHRRRGVGKALLAELAGIARERGIPQGWVLTDEDNEAGMGLYRSAGGRNPREVIEWEFDYEEG